MRKQSNKPFSKDEMGAVLGAISEYAAMIGASTWGIDVIVENEPGDTSHSAPGATTWAETNALPMYREARVALYDQFFSGDRGQQEEVLAHEVAHMATERSRLTGMRLLGGSAVSLTEITDANEEITSIVGALMVRIKDLEDRCDATKRPKR